MFFTPFIDPTTGQAHDLLPEGCACPACGERQADLLVWREDDSGVDCARCGFYYDPNGD